MFVYIWKDPSGIPFYVGLTKSIGRTNPKNNGNRNWLCRKKLNELGCHNVIVELRPVISIVAGQELERKLIAEYGRIQTDNGPLTNLSSGGDGAGGMSPEGKLKLSAALKDPSHPIRCQQARAKHKERMQDPAVKALFTGDNNPAKRPEVRAKIKAKWADPEYRAARVAERTGVKKHSDQFKDAARQRLLDTNHPMREYHKVLNSDPTIAAKRAATLRSPEQRTRQSEAMKANWAKRKAVIP
jgi:hypothetical protein